MVCLLCEECGARHKRHQFVDGFLGIGRGIGGASVGASEPHPEEHAALWLGKGHGFAQIAVQARGHLAGACCVNCAGAVQCGWQAPRLQIGGGRCLRQHAGVGIAELLAHDGLRKQGGGRCQPADTQAGRHDFAQAAAMRQPVCAAGHLWGQRQQAGRWRRIEIQIAIRVIFYHQHLILRGQLQDALAALQRQRGAAGVAEGGNQVNELGFVRGDQCLQLIRLHAVGICGGSQGLRAVQAKALDGREKGGRFHNHLVAGRDHALRDQIQRLLAARGDDELLWMQGCVFCRIQGAYLFLEGRKAFGRAVLQGFAWPLGERGMRGCVKAFHVEQVGIWKTTGKADDAGLAQQFEQFANGRGLDVLQALGKGKHGGFFSGWGG